MDVAKWLVELVDKRTSQRDECMVQAATLSSIISWWEEQYVETSRRAARAEKVCEAVRKLTDAVGLDPNAIVGVMTAFKEWEGYFALDDCAACEGVGCAACHGTGDKP